MNLHVVVVSQVGGDAGRQLEQELAPHLAARLFEPDICANQVAKLLAQLEVVLVAGGGLSKARPL